MGDATHNIDASGFRRGEYVGYCEGAWAIRRRVGIWRATSPDGRDFIERATLGGISDALEARARVHSAAPRVHMIHPTIGWFTAPTLSASGALEFQQAAEYVAGWPCWLVYPRAAGV